MKNENEYKQIASEIRKTLSGSGLDKSATPFINSSFIETTDKFIESAIPLIQLKQMYSVNDLLFPWLMEFVLGRLVTNEEFSLYCLRVLRDLYSDPAKWRTPNVKRDCKIVIGTGIKGSSMKNRLRKVYHSTFRERFVPKYYYPPVLIDEAAELIRNSQPLKDSYNTFKNVLFHGKQPTYYHFLDLYVLPLIGEETLLHYFQTMADEYVKTLPYYSPGTAKKGNIFYYIFGHYCKETSFTKYYMGQRKEGRNGFKKLFLRATFPFCFTNYDGFRGLVYDAMDLTDAEKETYEKTYYGSQITINRFTRLNNDRMTEERPLPKGSSIQTLYTLVDHYCDEHYKPYRTIPVKYNMLEEVKDSLPSESVLKTDMKFVLACTPMLSLLAMRVDDKLKEMKQEYEATNFEAFNSSNKCTFYLTYNGRTQALTLDMSSLTEGFRDEIRIYGNQYRDDMKPVIVSHMQRQATFCEYVGRVFQVSRCKNLKRWHILGFLKHIETERKLKPSSIMGYLSSIRLLIRAVMEAPEYRYRPKFNEADALELLNVKDHIYKTPIMPDDIYIFLRDHIMELGNVKYALIYRVMAATGFRFEDAVCVSVSGIRELEKDPEFAYIESPVPKTRLARRKADMDEMCADLIPIELYRDLKAYADELAPVREAYETDLLFFDVNNGMVNPPSSSYFNTLINEFLRRNGIRSIDEGYTVVTSRHARKKVASDLASAGVPIEAIQQKLNHVSPSTTQEVYAEVNKHRLAEKNSEFFRKQFEVAVSPDRLKYFNPEEREVLYQDFLQNSRRVPLGFCTKHPSEGACFDVSDGQCESCGMLSTGKAFLPEWERLLAESEASLAEYKKIYAENGIPEEDYSTFLEYRQELRHRDQCLAAINKIKETS